MKIGVFDSGIGGVSVANAIQAALPDVEILVREDRQHVPYGSRQPAEILQFILPIFHEMVSVGCNVIVVACNTVSTTLIGELRSRFNVPILAMEPMVKPAALLTRSGVIAVCATPTTLASQRYAWLKSTYAPDIQVLEPDCSGWSSMIEQGNVNHQQIQAQVVEMLHEQADVIVLGCTHYHWIEQQIKAVADGQAVVLQPEQPVIAELHKVLAKLA